MSTNICRVVPAIVARHPEILKLAKPRQCTKFVGMELNRRRKQIACIVEEKLCGK